MTYAFILTTLAGMATLIGTIPIFVNFKNPDKLIAKACSLASGVMICISVVDLIPEGIRYLSFSYKHIITISLTFIFMFIGIIVSLLLEYLVDRHNNGNKLYNAGILTMLVIILHNIPEGIVTFFVSSKNIILGIPLCLAIMLHNIPEGVSIAIPIYYATKSKFKAIFYTFISGISELLGAIITFLFLKVYISDKILGFIFSFTAGIMIALSFDKLLPTAKEYDNDNTYLYVLVGFLIMLISLRLNTVIS